MSDMIKLEYSPEEDHFILKTDDGAVILSQKAAKELNRLLQITPYLKKD